MKVAGALTALAVAGAIAGVLAQAPAPTFKRNVLQQVDISVPGREAVTALVEFQPNGTSGRHTHPGEEIGYILEGTFLFELEGKPPVTLKAGQTFFVPAGTIHNAHGNGFRCLLGDQVLRLVALENEYRNPARLTGSGGLHEEKQANQDRQQAQRPALHSAIHDDYLHFSTRNSEQTTL